MIRILSIVAIFAFVSGCTVHQSIGDNYGSGVKKPHGQDFKPVGPRWDFEHNALLYVYRPSSQWANDEIEAPSFNMNDKRLFNIKGGGYTWYELKPGEYDVVMRRGLFGLEGVNNLILKKVAALSLDVKAGETYYLRYSEIDVPQESASSTLQRLGDGPLQLVSADLALAELPATKMMHHGRDLLEPRPVPEDSDLERVFDGQLGTEEDSKARGRSSDQPKTKEEWWPF